MQAQYFISTISIILLMSDFDTGSFVVDGQFGLSGSARQSRKEGYFLRTSLANNIAVRSQPVEFFLFTRNGSEMIKPDNASFSRLFSSDRETKVIIHGFMQSATDAIYTRIKNAYLKRKDVNVVLVDWPHAKTFSYSIAATVTEYVGKQTAELLKDLNPNLGYVHMIGFGLGAHTAGIAGVELSGEIGRITGLDPSLPLFRMLDYYFKLDQEDGKYVDVIHTDAGDNFWFSNHLGMGKPSGSVDFYPNRGIFQPGCPTSSILTYDDMYCSHLRALEIFAESIEDPSTFFACKCSTWLTFMESKCDCTNENSLIAVGEGEGTTGRKVYGRYYFITNSQKPYGMGKRGSRSPRENTLQELIESLGNLTKITGTSEELNTLVGLTSKAESDNSHHINFDEISIKLPEEISENQNIPEGHDFDTKLKAEDLLPPSRMFPIQDSLDAINSSKEEGKVEKETLPEESTENDYADATRQEENDTKNKMQLLRILTSDSNENILSNANSSDEDNESPSIENNNGSPKIELNNEYQNRVKNDESQSIKNNESPITENNNESQSIEKYNESQKIVEKNYESRAQSIEKYETQIHQMLKNNYNTENDDTLRDENESETDYNSNSDSMEEKMKKFNLLYIIGTLNSTPIDALDTYRIL